MGELIYFSSASGNTERFIERLGIEAARIPISPRQPMPEPSRPFVLVCPTYADGQGRGAVAKQVIHFLNDARRRALLRGVIASGNRNFGHLFAHAGRVIAEKCQVPLLYRFELAGTDTDLIRVRTGLRRFWAEAGVSAPAPAQTLQAESEACAAAHRFPGVPVSAALTGAPVS